ncbi:MAG: lytic transglycosylase domain-containing protein [Paenibacillaceae bacterium]
MSINPKQMEELIKLRFLDSVGLFPDRSTTSTDSTSESEFQALLQSLVESNGLSEDMLTTNELLPDTGQGLMNAKLSSNYPRLNVTDYDQLINQSSAQYGVDANLIRSVIQTESGYKSDATSTSGAKGLMQLMDTTAASLGVKNSYDPQENINGGTKFLAYLLQKYDGNERVALAAYNAGPGRIDRLGISNDAQLQEHYDELPQETQNYIRKVMGIRNDG